MKLENRNIIITGASQGLGKAIAAACLREGANILICARDAKLLEQTRAELASPKVAARAADVSNLADVRALFDHFPRLDGLVNNAGVYGPKGPLPAVDIEEWMDAIRINLFGTMLACREAIGRGCKKIVNLSGGGATAPLPNLSAYAASKAAVVRLTETLALENPAIDINAIAPGALNTRMLDEVLAAGPERVGAAFYEKALQQKKSGGASLDAGSDLCVFLLSSASDGITGRLLSAIWDRWKDLPSHLEELRRTDIYTLRRIVPSDRALKWDEDL
ncbi:MAG: SDR family oxidoreductase [Acidobacteriia bacterium]|nr:SDR family oxidoreductase [Terriglobia bacterium]